LLAAGNGKIFYFRPGHEIYPTYFDPNVRRVIANAVEWARTVLAVERVAMRDGRMGLTVIFVAESGWPVVPSLLAKTPRGWRRMGCCDGASDRTTVRSRRLHWRDRQSVCPDVAGR
jgi:hypothetical protein